MIKAGRKAITATPLIWNIVVQVKMSDIEVTLDKMTPVVTQV